MIASCLKNVREKSPLTFNITNYVTVNDVANVILACGASPLMSDEPLEAGELATICDGLNLNIGTLNKASIEAMKIAGGRANELGRAIVLDPVGIGASPLREKVALALIEVARPTVIKGNASEIKTLSRKLGLQIASESVTSSEVASRGVDVDVSDEINEATLETNIALVKELSKKTGSVIAVTGAIDLVADADTCYVIRNGRAEMEKVTGTGCMLSGLTCAFVSANMEDPLHATLASVCMMGLAGELAYKNMQEGDGNATYRNRIIDAIFNMNEDELERGANYECR